MLKQSESVTKIARQRVLKLTNKLYLVLSAWADANTKRVDTIKLRARLIVA